MGQRMHRISIMLSQERYEALVQLSQIRDKSVSELIREFIDDAFVNRKIEKEARKQRQLALFDEIDKNREAILKSRGGKLIDIDVAEMINKMRDDHDKRIFETE